MPELVGKQFRCNRRDFAEQLPRDARLVHEIAQHIVACVRPDQVDAALCLGIDLADQVLVAVLDGILGFEREFELREVLHRYPALRPAIDVAEQSVFRAECFVQKAGNVGVDRLGKRETIGFFSNQAQHVGLLRNQAATLGSWALPIWSLPVRVRSKDRDVANACPAVGNPVHYGGSCCTNPRHWRRSRG